MQTLLERGLVTAVGRAEVIGRPITYGTSPAFLEYFGIRNLDELPAADELRRVVVQKPEGLLTVDPGLATAPPEQLTLTDQPAAAAPDQPTADAGPEGAADSPAANRLAPEPK